LDPATCYHEIFFYLSNNFAIFGACKFSFSINPPIAPIYSISILIPVINPRAKYIVPKEFLSSSSPFYGELFPKKNERFWGAFLLSPPSWELLFIHIF